MTAAVLPSISRMHAGDHYCGIFRTGEDHRRIVVDFVREGIARGEKMLYLVNIHTAAHLQKMLREAGIDAEPLLASGQLTIQAARDAYLKDGEFVPEKMIQLLKEATQQALDEGYPALRATGEMTWALMGEPGSERLVEYEALLNNFFPGSKCIAFCQYDRRRFDSEMLLDILHTHPKVLFGTEGYDNSHMYYVPPDSFLEADRPSAVLDCWLNNLSRGHPRD
jgi:hypothetical protein